MATNRKLPELILPGLGYNPMIPRFYLGNMFSIIDTVDRRTVTVSGTLTTVNNSLSGGVEGDLLVYHAGAWGPQNWVPALGVGGPLVLGATLSVSGFSYLIGPVNAPGALTFGAVSANSLLVTGSTKLVGSTLAGDLTAANLRASTLVVTGTTQLLGATNAGQVTAGPVTTSSLLVTGAAQILGATNLGATVLPTLTANSVTVTGALVAKGPVNLGDTVLPALTASTAIVTGATRLLGPTLAGDLTAGNLVASTLTVTGTSMLSGAVTLGGNLTAWGTNVLYGATNSSGVITASLVDSSNSSALYPLVLQHLLTNGVSGSTQSVGIDFYSPDFGGQLARYCFIKTFMNSNVPFGTALSFNTFSAGVATENLRLRSSQAWFPKDLQCEGSASFNGSLLAGPTTLSTLTVTGATQIRGATLVGDLTAGNGVASTLLVTGSTKLVGATLAGDLTAGNLVVSTLTVTGTSMLSGAVTAAGNVTTWGVNTLYGATNASGVITATLVDGSNSSALYPLVLEHRLAPGVSGSTQTVGIDFYSADGGATRARYCFIKTFMNNVASFGTALSFNTFTANAATENLRLRDSQAWCPHDLQCDGNSLLANANIGGLTAAVTRVNSLTVTGGVTVQGGVTVSGGITAIGRVRSLGAYTPVIAPFVAYTPTVTGADTGEIQIPFHPKDGSTTLNFASRSIRWRTAASGSTSGTITIQKSPAASTGAFDPASIGSLTLLPGRYEAFTLDSLGTLVSGDKIRVFVNLLPAATAWTVQLALESSDAPP